MPEDNTFPEGTPDPGPTGKIDLAKYRTDDLAERFVDLVSVPKAFRRIAKTASVGALLAVVACALIPPKRPTRLDDEQRAAALIGKSLRRTTSSSAP